MTNQDYYAKYFSSKSQNNPDHIPEQQQLNKLVLDAVHQVYGMEYTKNRMLHLVTIEPPVSQNKRYNFYKKIYLIPDSYYETWITS